LPTKQCLIKLNLKLVRNNYPFGRDWLFDAKRILGEVSVMLMPELILAIPQYYITDQVIREGCPARSVKYMQNLPIIHY